MRWAGSLVAQPSPRPCAGMHGAGWHAREPGRQRWPTGGSRHKAGMTVMELAADDPIADMRLLDDCSPRWEGSLRILRKITDFVDRDVAANSKPLSIILVAVPFLPFMVFVDGPPAERYPILAGLALIASICWLAFVIWRVLRHARTGLEGHGYVIGSARFWRLIAGTLLIVAAISAALMLIRDWIE
jgi:hypothetical protein